MNVRVYRSTRRDGQQDLLQRFVAGFVIQEVSRETGAIASSSINADSPHRCQQAVCDGSDVLKHQGGW